MMLFCGQAKQLKPALERYFSNNGKTNIDEVPFWFVVCKLDQLDMMDLNGLPVLNVADALPVHYPDKELTVLQALKIHGKKFWRRFKA